MKTKSSVLFAAALFACGTAGANEWQMYGSRALGMGGAFTAVARGPIAQYWNPAGMANTFQNTSGLEIPVTGRIDVTGTVMNDASTLKDLVDKYKSVQATQKTGGALNADQLSTVMQSLVTLADMDKPGQGMIADVGGGVNIKIKKFVISVNNYTEISGDPFVDVTNISLGAGSGSSGVNLATGGSVSGSNTGSRDTIKSAIDVVGASNIYNMLCGATTCNGLSTDTQLANALVIQAQTAGLTPAQIAAAAGQIAANAAQSQAIIAAVASGATWANNQSNIGIRGGSFTDLAMGYATQIGPEGLYVGGNLKVIRGQMGYTKLMVLSDSDQSKAFSNFTDDSSTSIKPGVDLGALYEFHGASHPRFGLVMRNINNPGFSTPLSAQQAGDPAEYNLNPQVRTGFAFNPTHWWTLATDLDVTNNRTILDGYHSRLFSIGSEFNVVNSSWFNIPLRVGYYKNIAESGSDGAITAGLGLDMLKMHFEVAGARSTKTQLVDGKNLPTDAALSATFSLLF